MNYSVSTLLKAFLAAGIALASAAGAAANGGDLSHLDIGQWFGSIAAALVAAGALLHKPSDKTAPLDKAATTVTDVVANAVEAHTSLTQAAVDSIKKVQEATGNLSSLLPPPLGAAVQAGEKLIVTEAERVLGPLASQVIGLYVK